jgi:hypothetical protein
MLSLDLVLVNMDVEFREAVCLVVSRIGAGFESVE